MQFKIYDSVKKEKLVFDPINKDEVRIYVCGPTVYDDSHLGHARSAIVFDLLRRVLCELGYKVIFAKNFTDIDDKIINKANSSGVSIDEITTTYIQKYLYEMELLGVKRADIEPKATESLESIVEMIEELLHKGYAYKTDNGDIYLSVCKDRDYGTLSGRIAELEAKSRIESIEQKKDSRDFALWKSYKGVGDIGYESKLGKGRPGWHIECSAMIDKHLAYSGEYAIDIHGGGADLLFPHHENESSQTRCAKNQTLAKYWIHNGFVTINNEKMSKSLGNSFFIKDALEIHNGEVLRFYLLSTHYRALLNYSDSDLLSSKKRLDRIYRLKKRIHGKANTLKSDDVFKQELLESLSDDLNISRALSIVDEFVSNANEFLDKKQNDKIPFIASNLELIARLLGVGLIDCFLYFQLGVSKEERKEIESLINKRMEAKKNKDFALADSIRDTLSNMGISIMDSSDGCVWEKL
ncbi:cysteine--tRNA ligase [Helicobacter ibis]|uniref:Cysteine--tRNA ligase n=1 Tax=Helicobacter ibis TaxID=2962633 RepID=A0ABT4VFV9_9HELI|nr:cysteine--tRNA ligase [Helicobacter ibis]MDA3969585.1 cysteine--tRNA ligase [Helicobacter ibis]